ncbi:MAG: hypothetical protein CMM59_20905 [Rhodospirillaceae bacterium]|nr:hypothetical protein [Rhodospirillaceae bacterium]
MNRLELRLAALDDALPETASPEMAQVLAYWRSLFKGDVLPDRRDLDPVQIPKLLPGIILIDIHRDPYRFRFRLIGERMVAYHGRNLAGFWMDEAFPHFNETATPGNIVDVAENHVINYRNGPPLMTYQKTFIEMERIFLPCRNGGDLVELLLTFTICR